MRHNPSAEIIAIGTEILLGELTDTNSVFIAQQLRDYGINLYFMTSVGDNKGRISQALRIAMGRADIIITCGGLGPTVDDMTRQAVADSIDRPLVFHQMLLDQIAARFAMFKAQMTENNRRQAYLPEGATVIENPVGTAPAFMVAHDERIIISLPGVPREMKFLMENRVLSILRERYQLGIIRARILKTAGIGESALDELLGDDLLNQSNPTVGLAAHHGIIDIRITAKAGDEAQVEGMLDAIEQLVRDRVGHVIFGSGDVSLESTLVDLLNVHQAKIAIVEAGIDDAIIAKLRGLRLAESIIGHIGQFAHPSDVNGAYGQVSSDSLQVLAVSVAQYACQTHNCFAGIAILSLPDVDEQADVDEGTAIAIYTAEEQKVRVYGFGGRSTMTRQWASRWAMANVWRMVKEQHAHVE